MNKVLIDIVGWVGAALLLFAYILVSRKKWSGDSFAYQLLNAIGSLCLILNTYYYRAFPSVAVNLVWITIACVTLVRRIKWE